MQSMLWVLLAGLSAVLATVTNLNYKAAVRDVDPYVASWMYRSFAALTLLPLLCYQGIPEVTSRFWAALLITGPIAVVGTILIGRALSLSDISVVTPLNSFTPLFLMMTSPFLLGETPKWTGGMGVLIVVAGSYLLHLREIRRGLLAPIRALYQDPGARLMLIVTVLWGVTSNFDKIGILSSSPLLWSVSINSFVSLTMLPGAVQRQRKAEGSGTRRAWGLLILAGICNGISSLAQSTAMTLAFATYVISIKRISALFDVLIGRIFFAEKDTWIRLIAVLVMLAGVLLITLSA